MDPQIWAPDSPSHPITVSAPSELHPIRDAIKRDHVPGGAAGSTGHLAQEHSSSRYVIVSQSGCTDVL